MGCVLTRPNLHVEAANTVELLHPVSRMRADVQKAVDYANQAVSRAEYAAEIEALYRP